MDFSEPFKYTGPTPSYSPNGQFAACAQEQRVVVREVEQLRMAQVISCLSKVQRISWSCNSDHLLCHFGDRAQVWSMQNQNWACKIDEGAAGVRSCTWSPDGSSVLVVADFQIRLSIHNILNNTVKVLRGPKATDRGIAFSPDGSLLAYAELISGGESLPTLQRTDCKEFVSLVSCADWSLRQRIAITTQDLAGLAWSPDSSSFVVWDTLLTYKLAVYSPDGFCLASFSPYQDALGIRTVRWSPDSQMLAVGSYDQAVTILRADTWRPVSTLEHRAVWKEEGKMVAYMEVDESSHAQRPPGRSRSRYIVGEFPFRVPTAKPPIDRPNPKLGVGEFLRVFGRCCGALSECAHWLSKRTESMMSSMAASGIILLARHGVTAAGSIAWSSDGVYLASQNENMPHSLFIWSAQNLELASLLVQYSRNVGHVVQTQPVRSFQWDPKDHRLVICTGGTKLYLWSPNGASCVHIPVNDFNSHAVEWAATGDALMLADRDTFCCAYIGFADE